MNDTQKREAVEALERLRDKLLEYYQALSESPHEVHKKDFVGLLYHFVQSQTDRVHSYQNPMAEFARKFETLVQGRLDERA